MTTKPLALAAALLVLLGAFAAMAVAIHRFNSDQGLPRHIGAGAEPRTVAPGQAVYITGIAKDAKLGTKLVLLVDHVPFHHHYKVIGRPIALGPSRTFEFVDHPRKWSDYRVAAAVDHQTWSRRLGVMVRPR